MVNTITARAVINICGPKAREVLAGLWYVNVLTEKYPDGEIRGQILPLKK